ncbi:DUF6349 family protein [Nocardioides daeguensis]|uniref:Uncharacterized protein n=1 Tax=Nocardioides daeguensis TaxID=908359 RepID=A0ABP6VT49_9ACTN
MLDHYPEAMQVTGAPVITERNNAGTRHVPGRSPWSGYDLSDSALTRRHEPSGVGLGD